MFWRTKVLVPAWIALLGWCALIHAGVVFLLTLIEWLEKMAPGHVS